MKNNDQAVKPSLVARVRAGVNGLGIRSRIFLYFLLFTGMLLVLLWVFQIVLLEDFYRHQKMEMLTSSADSIVRNINNEDLQTLSDRISEENGVCVVVMTEDFVQLVSSDATPGCIIHHMSKRDLRRYMMAVEQSDNTYFRVFPMMGFRNSEYDAERFAGRVPKPDDGRAQSMLAVQKTANAQGQTLYVLLNAVVTPVNSTVETLRNQLLFISAILVLLSFLLSLVLSRRITRPIVETTVAARRLSEGEFTPVDSRVSYAEVTQLNEQLTRAARDLQRVEGLQRELIANISHDLRTPLTLIEGYAEVMRDLPGENTPENMQVIIDETRRLSTLVNAVLEYSVTKSGQSVPKPVGFDLTQSVLEIRKRYAKLMEQDGYRVEFEFDKHVRVIADEMMIGQVVYNLMNNALTYTGENKTVTVRQSEEAGGVRLTISDTGEGIVPEELELIWSRYYRGQKPHKRAAVGTGLGLSIVKGILDGHGLPYGVQSEMGIGTRFWFVLPLDKGQNER